MGKEQLEQVRAAAREEQNANREENNSVEEENVQLTGNLQALQEIKAQSDAQERPGRKQGRIMGFFSRIWNYFKFNKKYKNGDMTTGENKQRSDNAYQNFLLDRVAFQSGGTSYQAQQDASITMSSGEARQSDASEESLDRMKTDEGDRVDEAAVNFVEYHNVLRLHAPKAVFKRGLFSSRATADYSSENAELKFMGDFRKLAVEGGVFHLQHEYLSEADKFGEIASMDFKYNTDTTVKTGQFFLSDAPNDINMQSSNTDVYVAGKGFRMLLKNSAAAGRVFTADKVHADASIGIFGKNSFDFNGSLTMDDNGFTTETEPCNIGKITDYQGVLNAENASVALSRSEEDGSLLMGAELSKWSYGLKMAIFELHKEGDIANPVFDEQGRLHIPCPGNLMYRVKLIGKDYLMKAVGDSNEVLVSDKSSEIAISGDQIEMFGKTFEKVNLTVGLSPDGSHKLSLEAEKAIVQEGSEGELTIKDIKADISDKGLHVTNASAEMSGKIGELEAESLTGTIQDLSLTKAGLEFGKVSLTGESLETEAFSVDAANVVASRSIESGLTLAVSFVNFTLPENEGKLGEMEYSIAVEKMSGAVLYQNKEITLTTEGKLSARVPDMLHIDLENIGYKDKALLASSVNCGLYGFENGISYKDYFSASALHITGENVKISPHSLVDENGGKLCFIMNDLSILGTELGDGEIEITANEVRATVSDLPSISMNLGIGTLEFSGGFGLSVTKGMSITPIMDDLGINMQFPAFEITAEGITSTDDSPLQIDTISFSSSKLPGLLKKSGISIINGRITNEKKFDFDKLSFSYEKEFSFFDDFLTIANPSLDVQKDLEGFGLGGKVSVTSDYFEGGGVANISFLKTKGYKPFLSGLEELEASIPKLAKASINELEIDESENGKLIKMKDLELSGYKSDEESQKSEDTTLFDRLCASTSNLRVKLANLTYDCAAKKFIYNKSELTFQADKITIPLTKNISGTVDFAQKKLSVEYEMKLPDSNFPSGDDVKAHNIPHLLELGGEITPIPFVGIGGDIFAGAYFKSKFIGTIGLDTTEKQVDLGLEAKVSAAAGVGLDAYLMLGMSKMFNVKVGLRGTLLGALDNGDFSANLGVTYIDGKLSLNKDPKSTIIKFSADPKLEVKLDAFVRAQLLGFINTDLYTFNLKTFEAISANIKGSVYCDKNGRWIFDKDFSIGSDFVSNAFNPASEKSVISYTTKAVKELNDLKNSAGEYERIYGLQDWGSEQAVDKSSKMQSEIFPMLDDIRKKNSESFSKLVEADSNILKTILNNNTETTKHQHRLLNQAAASESLSEDTSKAIDAIVLTHAAELEAQSFFSRKKQVEFTESEKKMLGKMNPASVAGYMYKHYGIVFDRSEFIEITDRYYDVRFRLNQAHGRNSIGSNVETSRNAFIGEYKQFVKTKDEGIDAYLKKNGDNFKTLQTNNKNLTDINKKMNELLRDFGDNMEDLERYYELQTLDSSRSTRKQMTAAQTKKLAEYRDEENTPIKKDVRKKFREYKKLQGKKSELLESISSVRASLSSEDNQQVMASLMEKNLEFSYNRDALKMLTNTIIEDNSTKATGDGSHDISFLQNEQENVKYYDTRILETMFPQIPEDIWNKSMTSFAGFKALCDKILDINAQENIAFYTKQFNDKITQKTTKSADPRELNNDFNKLIFSSTASTGAMKLQNSSDEEMSMSEGLTKYTKGRIAHYEGISTTALDTMDNLKTVISDSTDLYIRMNDLFFKLNQVNAASLTLPETAPSEEKQPAPVNYINSLDSLSKAEKLLKTGSDDRKKLGELKTQSDKLTIDVEKAVNINSLSSIDEDESA